MSGLESCRRTARTVALLLFSTVLLMPGSDAWANVTYYMENYQPSQSGYELQGTITVDGHGSLSTKDFLTWTIEIINYSIPPTVEVLTPTNTTLSASNVYADAPALECLGPHEGFGDMYFQWIVPAGQYSPTALRYDDTSLAGSEFQDTYYSANQLNNNSLWDEVIPYPKPYNEVGGIGTAPMIIASLEPGDANGDGMVDVNDLTIVLTNYGQLGRVWSQGCMDGDPTGKVDVNDLTIVLTNYAITIAAAGVKAGPALAVLPEPGTLAILAGGLAGPLAHAWRKRRQAA